MSCSCCLLAVECCPQWSVGSLQTLRVERKRLRLLILPVPLLHVLKLLLPLLLQKLLLLVKLILLPLKILLEVILIVLLFLLNSAANAGRRGPATHLSRRCRCHEHCEHEREQRLHRLTPLTVRTRSSCVSLKLYHCHRPPCLL